MDLSTLTAFVSSVLIDQLCYLKTSENSQENMSMGAPF